MKKRSDEASQVAWEQTFPHPDWNDPGDAVVWIDPAAFDTAWRETDQWVGPGGTIGGQDDRYRRVGAWIMAGNIVNMCEVAIDPEDGVSFSNGRHRFAWLRDHGAEAMPFQVAPDDVAVFEARFGTARRETRFQSPEP